MYVQINSMCMSIYILPRGPNYMSLAWVWECDTSTMYGCVSDNTFFSL